MRVELLHQVFKAVLRDCDELQLESTFSKMIESIESKGRSSARADNKEDFSDHVIEIQSALSKSRTRQFSARWKNLMSELGIEILLAENLNHRLDNLASQKTSGVDILKDVKSLFSQFQTSLNSIKSASSSFDDLGIGEDIIAGQDCELVFSIPAVGRNLELGAFIADLQTMNYHLDTFSEIVGIRGEDFTVKHISSKDYVVALDIDIDLGVLIVSTLEPLRESIGALDKKKSLIKELADLPEQIMADIQSWAHSLSDKSIDDVVSILDPFLALMNESSASRGPEIKKSLKIALRDIVTFWEKGYNIEVWVASGEGASVGNKLLSPDAAGLQSVLEKVRVVAEQLQPGIPEATSSPENKVPDSIDHVKTAEEASRQSVGKWRSTLRQAS